MNINKNFTITYAPLLCSTFLDCITKYFINNNSDFYIKNKYFEISNVQNHGIILGFFSDLPAEIRTVLLVTIGISIVACYPLLMQITNIKITKLKIGLSLLFGGILGNVFDRLYSGHVTDFISFTLGDYQTPAFNLADFIQMIAYILILSNMSKELNYHFLDKERRSTVWIDPVFQKKFILTFLASTFFISSVPLIFGYTFIKYYYQNEYLNSNGLRAFVTTAFFIQITLILLSVYIGKVISLKICGPIFAIKRFLKDKIDGKNYVFKLRENDEFKDIEVLLNNLNKPQE